MLLLALLFGYPIVYGQPPTWLREIVPMQTVISDVKDRFKSHRREIRDDEVRFELPEGVLYVGFSKGNCLSTTWGRWNIKEGIVLGVVYYPERKQTPKSLGFSLSDMEIGSDNEHVTYRSKVNGIYLSTEFGKVTAIHYSPAHKYEHLRCESNLK
jgi:hypothetical protein